MNVSIHNVQSCQLGPVHDVGKTGVCREIRVMTSDRRSAGIITLFADKVAGDSHEPLRMYPDDELTDAIERAAKAGSEAIDSTVEALEVKVMRLEETIKLLEAEGEKD